MKNYLYWLLPLGWMAIIFYSSSQPYQEQDMRPFLADYFDLSFLIPYLDQISFTYHNSVVSIDQLGVYGFIEFFIRKGAHVTVFLLLMIFFYVAITKTYPLKTGRKLIIALGLTIAYAAFDEWHQGLTPNRTPYAGDVVLDTCGALIGAGFILCSVKWKQSRK
ncbi:VanZ family protein [Sediminibacillus massiliensis]|uniref:VanZ family protein n=1 Tax=Sediminibacillus massiliensis TaxID=1926277 RepID=UPI0009884D74|nr:VanZ family protein [Sediminibacillus massiliensis]